jgi:hypothetical protein
MTDGRAIVLALICCPLFVAVNAPCTAQDAAHSAEAEKLADTIPLDEIIVNGRRDKPSQLRVELAKAEDAVYEAFNEANTEPEYATHCHVEVMTEGRSHVHICKPQFVDTANEDQARAIVNGYPYRPAEMVIGLKMPEYRKQIRDLAQRNPRLRKALGHYYSLNQRYEAALKERPKGKWFSWD